MVGVAEGAGDIGPELSGLDEAVPFVFEVVAGDDRVDSEPLCDYRQRLGFKPSFGQASLNGVQQIGGTCATLRYEFSGQVWTIQNSRQRGVDGSSPPVVGKV